MPTTLTNGIQLPDKGSVDWYSSMESNYNLIDTHLGDTDVHVTAEDKANWNSKQGSLSQDQLDAIAQVATNTNDIATLQSDKADASHTHSSSDITDMDDYATKDYVDNSISGLVDNAPDALNTLNELSAALNDDSNFATTVTNALAAKADSADLATVATSGDYDDLSNKPTINDSTITIQKNGSTVDTFTTNGSDKTIDISVPTKTSDLTNDSNFVESSSLATVATSGFYNDLDNLPTIPSKISDLIDDSNFVEISNPAVSSGITSTKVTDYDTHIADTDIHVTTADKTTWNTVSSKANDSDVVHKSGDETIGGLKTFTEDIVISNSDTSQASKRLVIRSSKANLGDGNSDTWGISFNAGASYAATINSEKSTSTIQGLSFTVRTRDTNNNLISASYRLRVYTDGSAYLTPVTTDYISLGASGNRWSKIYGTEYYYGSNNVEFSDKFVTTDTNQTINGNKTFSNTVNVYNSDSSTDPANIVLKNSKAERGSTTNIGEQNISFVDKDNAQIGHIKCEVDSSGVSTFTLQCTNSSNSSSGIRLKRTSTGTFLQPVYNNGCNLGTSSYRWYDVQTRTVNNLEPSSLSLPSSSGTIDISSYITDLTGVNVNSYTPSANGYIVITCNSNDVDYIKMSNNLNFVSLVDNTNNQFTSGILGVWQPCIAGISIQIRIKSSALKSARFVPCQGNV